MEKKDSISDALGISEEWRDSNGEALMSNLQSNDTISDAITEQIKGLKKKEFDVDQDATDYEKKLMWSGMELAFILVKRRQHQQAAASAFGDMLQQLVKSISKEGKDEDEDQDQPKKTRKKKE